MAEASENLKRQMAAHPELKKLAEQKLAMRAALIKAGVDEGSATDFSKYADLLKSLGFSIDSTIVANGYTYNYGTEEEPITLSSVMAAALKGNELLATMDSYGAGNFENDSNIMYLTVKPLASDISKLCYRARNLRYIPQLDFSSVKTMTSAFAGVSKAYVHDTYTIDAAIMTNMDSCHFRFCKKLIIKNMSNMCTILNSIGTSPQITSIDGINLSAAIAPINNWSLTQITNIGQCDDSIIRTANVISERNSEPTGEDDRLDRYDTETLYGFCTHAYDWVSNPRGLSKPADTAKNTSYYCYHFSEAVKERLAAAYPDVDFAKMMEDKGWTY